jgi:hypothetical protein
MARKRGVVLICAGFGKPLCPIPKSLENLCSTYQSVPRKRNLLASSGAMLHTFRAMSGAEWLYLRKVSRVGSGKSLLSNLMRMDNIALCSTCNPPHSSQLRSGPFNAWINQVVLVKWFSSSLTTTHELLVPKR